MPLIPTQWTRQHFFVAAIVLGFFSIIVVGLDHYLATVGKEFVNAWLQTEAVSIREGNLLASFSKNRRFLMSSQFVRGGTIYDDSSQPSTAYASFGDGGDLSTLHFPAHTGEIQTKRVGLYHHLVMYRFPHQQELVVVFDVKPLFVMWLTVAYCILLSLLLCALVWVTRKIQQSELSARYKIMQHIAHDLRSPLASLSVALEYFRGLRSGDSRMKDHVDLLNLSSKRLTGIAEGLLTKHKGGEATQEAAVSFSLASLLEELLHEFTLQAPQIQFVTEGDTKDITLTGSPLRLQRALGNLIKNAIEAMDGKGSLTLHTTTTSDHVLITITDTGKGMSAETLTKILHGGHSEGKEHGHGIGMTVVREVIDEMGGTLEATSVLGHGTTFTITLPCLSPHTVSKEANVTASPKQLTVMVIDDDDGILLSWKVKRHILGITMLHTYLNMEAATSNGLDLASIDIAFIDKHVEGSEWSLPKTVTHLKENGVKKIIIASGDSATSLRDDPECSEADGISGEKIPKSLQEWI